MKKTKSLKEIVLKITMSMTVVLSQGELFCFVIPAELINPTDSCLFVLEVQRPKQQTRGSI